VTLLALALLAACAGAPPPAPRGFWFPGEGRVVDLTRADAGARPTTLRCGLLESPDRIAGATVDRLEPGLCIATLVVLDVRERAAQAPELSFTVEDLAEHEARRGTIPPGAAVVLATGGGQLGPWSRDARPRLLHPGFAPSVVELLVRQRAAVALGSDAPALEPSSAGASEATGAALRLGAYVLTNLTRLDQLSGGSAILLLAPPLERGLSAPVRVLALAPRAVGRASR
jgi:kynurenine formamidase